MRYLLTVWKAQRRGDEEGLGGVYAKFCECLLECLAKWDGTRGRMSSFFHFGCGMVAYADAFVFLGLFVFYQIASRFTVLVLVVQFFVHGFWVPQIVR